MPDRPPEFPAPQRDPRVLDELLADCSRGTAWFKVYRQFKMYNDPALNPHLAGKPTA